MSDVPAQPDEAATIDRDGLSSGITWLVRGIAVISIALPLLLADEPWSLAAPVFGPAGALCVAVGSWRIRAATPVTVWGTTMLGLALVAVPLRVASEVGVLTGAVGRGLTPDDVSGATTFAPGPWDYVAVVTLVATVVGVISLARHLNLVLSGVAADRWRQVLFGWGAALVVTPLALATGFLELFLLAAATFVTAGALLVLSLLATYRAAEDDTLDKDFAPRGSAS